MENIVIIESPYAGDVELNKAYLKVCILDCLIRGESPYASHSFLPDILSDDDPVERQIGIGAGLVMHRVANEVAFYIDLGVSKGMKGALEYIYEKSGVGDVSCSYRSVHDGFLYRKHRQIRSSVLPLNDKLGHRWIEAYEEFMEMLAVRHANIGAFNVNNNGTED